MQIKDCQKEIDQVSKPSTYIPPEAKKEGRRRRSERMTSKPKEELEQENLKMKEILVQNLKNTKARMIT